MMICGVAIRRSMMRSYTAFVDWRQKRGAIKSEQNLFKLNHVRRLEAHKPGKCQGSPPNLPTLTKLSVTCRPCSGPARTSQSIQPSSMGWLLLSMKKPIRIVLLDVQDTVLFFNIIFKKDENFSPHFQSAVSSRTWIVVVVVDVIP